ncbi:hypothetical protein cypCar_00011114 [Cyprinus carpio]|nr:hypothetical protein cypCar_00011114 [Cyprinus carpio]
MISKKPLTLKVTLMLAFNSRPSELLQKSTLYLSHFKTGDLGLVPRKTHTTSSKTGNLSRSAYTYVNK